MQRAAHRSSHVLRAPTSTVLYRALSSIAPDRDFIFFDQRGTGDSHALSCPESGEDKTVALRKCYERLSQDIDLNAINSRENARIVDSLRQAFNYPEWNLYGMSYGTRLGLTVMRDHPEGVRSAILDSVVPLEQDLIAEFGRSGYSSFQKVFTACTADEECHAFYPEPEAQLLQLVEDLNEAPVYVEESSRTIDGDYVVFVLFRFLYSPATISLIPSIINELSMGNFSLFEQPWGESAESEFAWGMHLSLHCSEEVPFSSEEQANEWDEGIPSVLRPELTGTEYYSWCESWPVARAPASENDPVSSDRPALLFSGGFDPVTPPSYAEAAHELLGHSTHVHLEYESHGASLNECAASIGRAFLDDPNSESTLDCSSRSSRLEFELITASFRGTDANTPGEMEFKIGSPSDEDVRRAMEKLLLRLR